MESRPQANPLSTVVIQLDEAEGSQAVNSSRVSWQRREDSFTRVPQIMCDILASDRCFLSRWLSAEVESRREESSRVIHHTEYDAETVGRMVKFLYTQDYDPPTILKDDKFYRARMRAAGVTGADQDDGQIVTSTKEDLIAHVHVHGIAIHYGIPQLKLLATEKFTNALSVTPWHLEHCLELTDNIYQQPVGQTSRLRSLITDLASNHLAELGNNEPFLAAVEQRASIGAFYHDLVPLIRSRVVKGMLV